MLKRMPAALFLYLLCSLLCQLHVSAQTYNRKGFEQESPNLVIPPADSAKQKIKFVLGAEIGFEGIGFAYNAKIGISYKIEFMQVHTLLEYNANRSKAIMADRIHSDKRFFPHLLAAVPNSDFQVFVLAGFGTANYSISGEPYDYSKDENVWGFGGGFKYKNFTASAKHFRPDRDNFDEEIQITIGFLMSIF